MNEPTGVRNKNGVSGLSVAILHSKDLVNWRMIGQVVNDLTSIGLEYNYNRHTHGMEVEREPNQGGLVQTDSGEMVWGDRKPINGHSVTVLSTNDDFDRAVLELH
ncbi:hypothetical protein QFZ77_006392 [Paenibacillus sp. V4I3]|uniref:hypothetical protein n=1 Tax=unclassified Paenibacillus TaxID=185978 RepID=UPI00278199E6|nr:MULTISPECIES: hypothetical protein [unclassified Paenibacillus]MDQ0877733.1 hypothetical protein [Paenibacillus sp. V4I3]MDQ0886393.1 hypothetical protein [Paenibacillus sp. V4I9]